MTNIVLAAALAVSPADWAQLTNRIDVLWTEHTNRVERIERMRRRHQGPPDRPFRVKGGRR